ncbi:hypothetical protein MCOR27_000272 [Pyricularia oryzae]|uniref:Large ribosomal subunit protein mL46 n=5 Tax=Pyricularia TaxID=48558 RepID=A0ABQ8P250_PYRGI|nr:54S ribosomal protein L17 [Pyricularia oryzae 70-15]ELQ39021.1 54S ribosomal protein L17 [Pyricularia oryzae Y34]KAH8848090.1 hypothetical protein MCOR01_001481 [Pyricularia oryzae]KAI6304190.1 hypothetical protein MCOR33_000704 [Pyricularia grisea]EHA52901.1 54S ribosomal protein L17 [Pyricularia oryzae 70-15]KAH9429975.1 hypothetical protein MCOR02_009697 [Pyricularia oryzae]
MSASSRGWHALRALSRSSPRVCAQCARGSIQTIPRRAYSASAAPTVSAVDPSASSEPPVIPAKQSPQYPKSDYRIRSGLILTRAPLLTRDPTPFESAFYLYQKRLNERLVSPFISSMWFKQDTPPQLDWNLKLDERKGIWAKDVGHYKPRGSTRWADEVHQGSPLADPELIRERLLEDAQMRYSDDGELLPEKERLPVEKPQPRRSEADEKNDLRRLDRAMDRTLYLVVKKGDGWAFPASEVRTEENLHEAAARVLEQAAGVNMNTWMVGRVPVAHHVVKPKYKQDSTLESKGSKTFLLKGRIFAGQADIKNNALGVTDFMWLTQDELKKHFDADYFMSIKNMFSMR